MRVVRRLIGMSRSCPDCGYDLRGVIDSWESACPLEFTCSECGTGLRSAEILNPAMAQPRWSFEHGRNRRFPRFFLTVVRLFWPVSFWGNLPREDRLHWWRLMLFVALMVGAAVVWVCVLSGNSAYYRATHNFRSWTPTEVPFETWGQFKDVVLAALWPVGFFENLPMLLLGWGAVVGIGALIMPLPLLAFWRTLRGREGSYAALVRGWCYQFGMIAFAAAALIWHKWRASGLSWTNFLDYSFFWLTPWWSAFSRTIVLGFLAWWLVYWSAFIRLHLRLPRPWLIWAFAVSCCLGLSTFWVLQFESDVPRIEIGLFLAGLFGSPSTTD